MNFEFCFSAIASLTSFFMVLFCIMGLTHFDLLAARTYYRANPEEIDALIASHHSDDNWDV